MSTVKKPQYVSGKKSTTYKVRPRISAILKNKNPT